MGKRRKKTANRIRSEPINSGVGFFLTQEGKDLFVSGYTRLSDNPEVRMGIEKIADLVSSMTIHLMENGEDGDVRIQNELSKKIDISPHKGMTRKNFIFWLVFTLLLEGDGNAIIYPKFQHGYLNDLLPIPPTKVTFQEVGYDYQILISGKAYLPDELLHFSVNPDSEKPWLGTGYRYTLRDVTHNLKQAMATKKAFMSSEYMPNLIVSVDTDSSELSSEEGREKFENAYLKRKEAGKPWIIPEGFVKLDQIKPLSLQDIAINDAVTIDKRTVAGLLGVPAFILGVGDYNKDEYNNFINTRIMSIAQNIQQTLTAGLIDSPKWYFKMNPQSLYAYDMDTIVTMRMDMYVRGLARGNEVRNAAGMNPDPLLNDFVMLENYIPKEMIGKQKKLIGKEKSGNEN